MMMKPRFSSPSSASAGRRTSWKNSCAVSEVCWPIFSILRLFSNPGSARVDQEQGRALGALARVRDRRDDDQVRVDAVGDENLGAVQDPLIAIADGVGANALYIRAGTGLGHRQGAESLAADHLRQPLLFLRLRAVATDVGGDDVGVDAVARGDAAETHARELLDEHQGHVGAGTGAAVGFVHVRAQEARGAERIPQLARYEVILLPLLEMRGDFLLEGAPRHVPEQGHFVAADIHVHDLLPVSFLRVDIVLDGVDGRKVAGATLRKGPRQVFRIRTRRRVACANT
jgi:hypothetical protein